jgi:hypothetical protein
MRTFWNPATERRLSSPSETLGRSAYVRPVQMPVIPDKRSDSALVRDQQLHP